MIKLLIGFDQRKAVAFHTFCHNVIERSSQPVAITPLMLRALPGYQETHTDGSNTFIYSRFLTPHLCDTNGWAIFAYDDMICRADLAELWALRDETKAFQIVQHDYQTKAAVKYLVNKDLNYPRKNWSSLELWNCGHPKHRLLTPEFVVQSSGGFLHRFSWPGDEGIGSLPADRNWLTSEYYDTADAKLLQYTLGTPCFEEYREAAMAGFWHDAHVRSLQGMDS